MSLPDYVIKSLLQDVEASNKTREEFSLQQLVEEKPSTYGEKGSDLRRGLQRRFYYYKRRCTPQQYLKGRNNLPEEKGVRCGMAEARVLGPNDYDLLMTPYVLLTVAPSFTRCTEPHHIRKASNLLCKTYENILNEAKSHPFINQVALPLLASGSSRGDLKLHKMMEVAVLAVYSWALDNSGLKDIVFFVESKKNAVKFAGYIDDTIDGCIKAKLT
ncbi:unknown protein [Seminavis robusta]|uniref:Macro domain-containing protein n=1 Tax=Seminavis robusta TaxID=568900 RepID=A0A9N8E4G3_9STRA|nr:unknown protein [Seminavis robusta]|eukprot:Sro608_g174840.1 n/a (216) ;mRNA; f:28792-29439